MKNHDRAAARLEWIRRTLDDASLTLVPASADASFRSYWRTHHAGQSWIVMDSPPEQEDPAPWVEIGARLSAAGLHVPKLHAQDLEQGFLLIEDLGSTLYLPALDQHTVDSLYGDAMDALLIMQRDANVDGLPAYDGDFLTFELAIMVEWFLGRHLGCELSQAQSRTIDSAFDTLTKSALEQPRCFVHRDFHSRNLLITPVNSPGVIDFQGALHGPITYDLASLLRDCYVVWDPAHVEAWAESYRQRLLAENLIPGDIDAPRFRRWFDLIGLQRHIKVLGIFCRLCYRDGKPGYLGDLPRVYDYVISVAARYHELAAFVALLQQCVGGHDLRRAARA
jgi:aminoglycoside/choline kinase family phosphotransferase